MEMTGNNQNLSLVTVQDKSQSYIEATRTLLGHHSLLTDNSPAEAVSAAPESVRLVTELPAAPDLCWPAPPVGWS